MIYLTLIPLVILAFLLWKETQRSRELVDKLIGERAASEGLREAERAEWGKERRQLLNRVQSPETAIYEDFTPALEKPYVSFDSDDEFWESKQLIEDSNGSS